MNEREHGNESHGIRHHESLIAHPLGNKEILGDGINTSLMDLNILSVKEIILHGC